ncbi:hypothetical protein ZWY2020_028903 [Hordeum vulgare]|nr:hypothetical protein ZWY2020_028903 [Hordeum vulgare]
MKRDRAHPSPILVHGDAAHEDAAAAAHPLPHPRGRRRRARPPPPSRSSALALVRERTTRFPKRDSRVPSRRRPKPPLPCRRYRSPEAPPSVEQPLPPAEQALPPSNATTRSLPATSPVQLHRQVAHLRIQGPYLPSKIRYAWNCIARFNLFFLRQIQCIEMPSYVVQG